MATVTSARATALDAWVGKTIRIVADKTETPLGAVATAIGISPSALTGKLKGQRPWTATEVKAVADLLGVDVARLYDGDGGYVQPPSDFHSAGDDLKQSRTQRFRIGRFSTAAHCRYSFVSSPFGTLRGNGGKTWMPHRHISTFCVYGAHHSPRSTHGVVSTPASRRAPARRWSRPGTSSSPTGTPNWPAASSRTRRPRSCPA